MDYFDLKGVCHEIFDPYFFMIRTHLGLWLTAQSIFEFGFDFAEIFDHKVVSAVCIPPQRWSPRSQSPWCASHRGENLRGLHPTVENFRNFQHLNFKSLLVVLEFFSNLELLSRGDDFCSAHHTAETISTVCIPLRRQELQIQKNLRSVQHTSAWDDLRGVHPTAKSISAVCIQRLSQSLQCASHR